MAIDGLVRSARCSIWWSDSSSAVQRSVFMDDYVYSIATDVVRVKSLSALGQDVASAPLTLNAAVVPGPRAAR